MSMTPGKNCFFGVQGARLLHLGLAFLSLLVAQAQAFDLQAHRGGRGLLPENTLAAFENAIRMGVTTLELDIAITADGVPVISHDAELNPAITRDAQGQWLATRGPLIKTLTLAQLQAYDVGHINPASGYAKEFPDQQPRDGQRISTLASLFKRVNDLGAKDIHFDMETKINPHYPNSTLSPQDFVNTLLEVIRSHGMTRMVRASAGQASGVIWAPFQNNLSEAQVKEAQALGLQVIPWTVNQKAQMQALMAWGVDGIITDYPDRLREVLQSKGMILPLGVRD